MFYGAPGRRLFATIGAGPIRGAQTINGTGYVVSGGELYQLSRTGVATLIGGIPGTGRVTIQHNDTQAVIMHSAGWHAYPLAGG